VHHLGGDPGNVTLIGQSAGAQLALMCVIEAAEAAAAEMTEEAGEAVGAGGEGVREELAAAGRSDKSTGKSIKRQPFLKVFSAVT